jgi:hypothetical protein
VLQLQLQQQLLRPAVIPQQLLQLSLCGLYLLLRLLLLTNAAVALQPAPEMALQAQPCCGAAAAPAETGLVLCSHC